MLSWLKRFLSPQGQADGIAHQPPGDVFPWTKGVVLTAVDEVTIALPKALIGEDEVIGSVILGSDDALISIPPEGDKLYIRLKPGTSASVSRSCQAFVVAEDGQPKRIKVHGSPPATHNEP